eukprot:360989-Prymnesium_polylepis.1
MSPSASRGAPMVTPSSAAGAAEPMKPAALTPVHMREAFDTTDAHTVCGVFSFPCSLAASSAARDASSPLTTARCSRRTARLWRGCRPRARTRR